MISTTSLTSSRAVAQSTIERQVPLHTAHEISVQVWGNHELTPDQRRRGRAARQLPRHAPRPNRDRGQSPIRWSTAMLTPNLDRLQRLRTLMQNTPGERVDLITWTYEDPKCGTIACAVGWATQAPEFQKEGLMLSDGAPYYRGQYDWDAVTSFFGITEGQAEYLFLERRPQPKSYYRDDTKQLGETIPADDHELDDQSDRALILHRLDTFIRNAS